MFDRDGIRDYRWQQGFDYHLREIISWVADGASHVVEVAPEISDREQNTDYVLTITGYARFAIAARVRSYDYLAGYGDEISVRWDRISGVPTERAKMLDGHGDFMVYGFAEKPCGTPDRPSWCEHDEYRHRMCRWTLGDLDVLRRHIKNGVTPKVKPNPDGHTFGAYFRLLDLPGFELFSKLPKQPVRLYPTKRVPKLVPLTELTFDIPYPPRSTP